MRDIEISIKLIGWLLGVVGSLLLLGGGLIAYIFKRHVQDNDRAIENNRQDHIKIFDRIEEIERK